MALTSTKNRPGEQNIRLRLLWLDPPPRDYDGQPAVVGMPDADKSVHTGAPRAAGAEEHQITVAVRARVQDAPPDFAGPFVHGRKGERFLYFGWQHAHGHWIRRWKVLLTAITWTQIEQAAALPQGGLHATVRGGNRARVSFVDDAWTLYDG